MAPKNWTTRVGCFTLSNSLRMDTWYGTPRAATFKKRVVLETLREDKTLVQIASEHGVHPMQIAKWKKELLDGMEALFEHKSKRHKGKDQERELLERKIGQLTIELDYLKKTGY